MARHSIRPGVKPFQVSAELRGRGAKHRKAEEQQPQTEPKQEQPASAAA
ncbi:hypothetical protein [Actinocrispum sp. NPDC049592]